MSNITINDLGLADSAGYKNLMAIKDYTKKTRDMMNELRVEMKHLQNQLEQEKLEKEQLKQQIINIQIRLA
jgi:CII-binding regulator of phage lambda lysogenization HflD